MAERKKRKATGKPKQPPAKVAKKQPKAKAKPPAKRKATKAKSAGKSKPKSDKPKSKKEGQTLGERLRNENSARALAAELAEIQAETQETVKKRREPEGGWAEPWMGKFIDHLSTGGTVSMACDLAVIGRATAYRHRQKDEAFAIAWADAEEESTERLEEEAYRRAFKGVKKPVHYQGLLIDHVQEHSDTMLIFLLKARKPLTYRDRIDLNHSGSVRNPKAPGAGDTLDLSKLDQKEIDELERLHSKAAATEEAPA